MAGVPQNSGANRVSVPTTFPKRHLLLLAAFALTIGAFLSLTSGLVAAKKETGAHSMSLELAATIPATMPAPPAELAAEPIADAELEPVEQWLEHTIRFGDNLSLVFRRAGLNDADVYHIVSKAEGGKALKKIFPGQSLGFQIDANGDLSALLFKKSPLESIIYRRHEDSYLVEAFIKVPERRRTFASATIDSSLFLAGEVAGMSQNTIMEFANIFGGVIDFVLDPRKSDTFYVLYEELYLDGEKFDNGDILAAEFINQGRTYNAFIYTDTHGRTGYFSKEGVSMRKAFMLAPLDFTRVSSNFNMRRLHPIYKTTRPHRGTDYAASRGTPVFAAGDGRVSEAGYTRANGNYLVIKHGEQFTTKYLHLNKRKVKKGARVEQHQVIGTVGATGAATGPHLHYEFLVNGVHRNPRTIHKKLPKAKSLSQDQLARFQKQIAPLSSQLASLRQTKTASTRLSAQTSSVL